MAGRLPQCAQRFGLVVEAAGEDGGIGGGIACIDQLAQGGFVQQRQVARKYQPGDVRMSLLCGENAGCGADRIVAIHDLR